MPDRRKFLKSSLKAGVGASSVLLLSVLLPELAWASSIVAVRVWPARDYSRVTLESAKPLNATHFLVTDPDRLVVDIEGLVLDATLKNLVSQIQPNDPYIRQVRVGQNKPTVVRMVFDLKAPVNPQVFNLAPVGEYQNRLVLDLYPTQPADPLLALVDPQRPNTDNPQRTDTPAADIKADSKNTAPDPKPETRSENKVEAKAEVKADPRADTRARPDERANIQPDKNPAVARMITIALDPGHGGEDPGAIGRGGSREKDVVLSIARRIRGKLEAEPNVRVMLTRDDDYFVPLHVRVQKARQVQADLFVSIHADGFISPQARGSSVFALSERGATSTTARWMADKENAADLIGGVNINTRDQQLAHVLLDLSTTQQITDSIKLANAVLHEIGGINKLHKGAVEQAGFAVLKAPDIPSILIETAFISNPDEEKRLNDEAYQEKMAFAVISGIRRYFARNPPLAKSRLVG